MTAARPLPMSGDPEPMRVWVSVYGSDGALLFHVMAKHAEHARALIAEEPRAEVVYFDGPGVPQRAWRDAVTRQWRAK